MSAVSPTLETTRRTPLFCDVDLAARIEQAEVRLIAEASAATRRRRGDAAGFVIPIAGGVASFAEHDSPMNKVAGLGFGGGPNAAELDEVERAFAAHGVGVQIELAHLVDPEIGVFLTERGYRLVSFENVLGCALTGEHREVTPAGVTIRASREDEFDAWLDVMADGVAQPDTQGLPSHEEFPRDVLLGAMRDLAGASGVRRYSALRDGVLAGGGSLRISDGVAQFGGAATVPAHRRRGIQSALVAARFVDATAAGCDIAVVTTQPGSRSQQNVQRQGFDLLYTRAVLTKQP
ncbi:GNAT family N-acetyltransferase [Frankia sp. AgB32]|uniref:GNAT family N-acetyltransferase n=1 Tax=Frankia sp. AgB32 TaxID=631119 RepID=UPI00200D4621|nr:GNAT family N-acetyltransferase [Frankia sp. AgB32]MCK9893042.1 GNAT family N-acetyltransferase [Frankia sp. AgB32]